MLARFVRAVALLLFAGQAIVAQAHVHAQARWTMATAAPAAAGSTPASQRPDDPFACPVCREIAHAGAYLTPTPIAVAPPADGEVHAAVANLRSAPAPRPSHAWQSRAPPIPLPA